MDGERVTHPTIMRGFVVLEKVVQAPKPVSTSDLIEELGLPKPTLNRILQQLEQEGLVEREPVSRRYIPGLRAREFSLGIMSNHALSAPRHAILKVLSQEVDETCNCTMLDGDHTVYFDRVEANWPYRIQLPVGSQLPLHCTASGKMLLAHMTPKVRDKLVHATPLKSYTPFTLTDSNQLQEELDQIRREGIAFDREEFMEGMVAIAVPVRDKQGSVCFTVSVHAPKIRKSLEELRLYLPFLNKAANALAKVQFE
ncbi:IclR family transcriptional regulator [Vibrio nigripulchritudo]|uniref:IclR family transcriptional regulator n=1 Tax=Vibrio nigripulchritudo TaxID=28173 RepID=UPI0003B1DAE5|nr:IclR family transcriptional regulator [Vibrio nigripulchritudo]CCN70314.1 putative Transcriptional regulator, IclR family protein [Vibrio nigripulchritudo SFn118]